VKSSFGLQGALLCKPQPVVLVRLNETWNYTSYLLNIRLV
jgi:hypothetical protein